MTTIDIDSLVTAKTIDLSNINSGTKPSTISSIYSPFYLFVENRNSYDEPSEMKYNLYDLYKFGLDNLIEENDRKITIGETITVLSKFFCTDNFDKIGETFKKVDTKIDYDEMNSILPELQYDPDHDNYEELFAVLWKWVNENVYDFSVKQNPEDADDSNLILTKNLLGVIKEITESIIDKIYRNFTQLIRVRHDYRLYGKGATIFGGWADNFSSSTNISKWSSLANGCWTQYKGQYIVGKSAYGEEISNSSGSGTIKNATYSISPYMAYGVAAHKHSVSMNIGSINGNIELEMPVHSSVDCHYNGEDLGRYCGDPDYSFTPIREYIKKYLLAKGGGIVTSAKGSDSGSVTSITTQTVTYSCNIRYKYYWNSDNCKLVSPEAAKDDIYSRQNIILPTYSSYVWKWTGDDTTSVSSIT